MKQQTGERDTGASPPKGYEGGLECGGPRSQ